MKRSFIEFFKREYQAELEVNSRWRLNSSVDQMTGIDVSGSSKLNGAQTEKLRGLIRELRPKILRIRGNDADTQGWLRFCREEMICPHLCFACDEAPAEAGKAAAACREGFSASDIWEPKRFYEVMPELSLTGGDSAGTMAEQMRNLAGAVRAADPEGTLILGGLFPSGSQRMRAEAWNRLLTEVCGDVMDLLGVSLFPDPVNGRAWDEDADGIEAASALAEEVGAGLMRLKQQLPEGMRAAVTGWSFLRDGSPQLRQHGIYYAAVQKALRKAADWIPVAEAGPLFDTGGLMCLEADALFGNVLYHSLKLAVSDLPIVLDVREREAGKAVPVYHWEGLPGSFDGKEIRLADAYASASSDGKRIFLMLSNLSPYRRAVLRIRFTDFPNMHPIEARVLRSKKRLDGNDAAEPERVFCKEVKLRNYRKMDHVNLDIPECSMVCMLLE